MVIPVPRCGPRRWGFTLIEALIVFGILAVVCGLLLSAVQKARAAAAEAGCKQHLHQVGLALHLFHTAYGTFPGSGGYRPGDRGFGWRMHDPGGGDPNPKDSWTSYYFGLPDPTKGPGEQMGSWPYSILPFLEQDNIYRAVDYGAPQPVFACPARHTGEAQACPGIDPVNPGITYDTAGINPWSRTDFNANALLIQCNPHPLARISDITDGASNTILAGEKSLDPRNYYTGAWYWNEPAFLSCNTRSGTSIYRDRPGVPFVNNWGSAHAGGAGFLFVDGSIRVLRFGLSSSVVAALLTPREGDEPGNDF